MFLFLTLRSFLGRWIWLFFVWSASICYAQVYVGVHYPLDVLCGALLGLGIGWLTGTAFLRQQASLELT
jgi:undecaprenyl-diphosphatase